MSKIKPRFTIPDEWGKGRCPVCNATPMQVVHSPDAPDQIVCSHCGLACEAEEGGPRIRPKKVPSELGHRGQLAANMWITASELRALARQSAKPAKQAEAVAPVEADETIERAKKLYALGNSIIQIKTILEDSKATPEQVEAALAEVTRLDRKKRENNQRSMWLMGSVGAAFFLLIAGVAAVLVVRPELQPPTATPRPTSPVSGQPLPGLPGLPNLPFTVPTDAVATVMAQPTTGVQRGVGPQASKCPATPIGAAQLFGGKPDYWSENNDFGKAWVMIATSDPLTISVPANMSAGYIRMGEGLEMISVVGPATLTNVNFVTISCEQ